MSLLRWDKAVTAGVVSDAEADLLRECVDHDEDGVWRITTTGLDADQCVVLERAIRWFCSEGPVQ